MRRTGLLLFSSLCVLSGPALLLAGGNDLPVVPNLDLERYTGKWFEIARLPTSFQRKCQSDVTATYTRKSVGQINVVNTCRQTNGKTSAVTGVARLRDRNGPAAKLKVTFFWPFSGNYWVIDLDPEYKSGRWSEHRIESIFGFSAARPICHLLFTPGFWPKRVALGSTQIGFRKQVRAHSATI